MLYVDDILAISTIKVLNVHGIALFMPVYTNTKSGYTYLSDQHLTLKSLIYFLKSKYSISEKKIIDFILSERMCMF